MSELLDEATLEEENEGDTDDELSVELAETA
jgi:hypothetical protein